MNKTKTPPIEYFNEEDDIILPDTIFGEIYYIKCILTDIIKNPDNTRHKLQLLRRQIGFFIRWQKTK